MDVKFHGFEVGKDFNDPTGVFKKKGNALVIDHSIAPAPLSLDEITEKKKTVDVRLGLLIERIRSGQASAEDVSELSSVAAQAKQLAIDLENAQEAVAQQEQHRRTQLAQERRQQFDKVVAQAKEQRTKFFQLFRETSLALGEFCSSVAEATDLANSMATGLGVWPEHSNVVRELSDKPDPLPSLLESGFKPTKSHGWNFNITVLPLRKLGEDHK